MSETSHRNIDRRMVMTLATGILAAGVTPAGAASSQEPSREFLACVAAYQERARNAGLGDEVLYRLDEEFAEAIDRFLDKSAPASLQRLGEAAVLWRLDCWDGDEKVDEPTDPGLERAIWTMIEELSGLTLPDLDAAASSSAQSE